MDISKLVEVQHVSPSLDVSHDFKAHHHHHHHKIDEAAMTYTVLLTIFETSLREAFSRQGSR